MNNINNNHRRKNIGGGTYHSIKDDEEDTPTEDINACHDVIRYQRINSNQNRNGGYGTQTSELSKSTESHTMNRPNIYLENKIAFDVTATLKGIQIYLLFI